MKSSCTVEVCCVGDFATANEDDLVTGITVEECNTAGLSSIKETVKYSKCLLGRDGSGGSRRYWLGRSINSPMQVLVASTRKRIQVLSLCCVSWSDV